MSAEQTIVVPLADGFEEIEAVTVVDVLRRAGLHVTVAGLRSGPARGSHGISVGTDATLDEVDPERVAMVVLPGGMPGTANLIEDERVLELVRRLHGSGRPTAAICAAPMVLERAGVLEGLRATSHPSVRGRLGGAVVVDQPRVVQSGTVLTSQGVGTALEFALRIVEHLRGPEQARELARAMVVGGAGEAS